MRERNREYRVPLSNGKTLKIIAVSPQRAYLRAMKWAATQEGNVTVKNVYEVENT